MQIRLLTFQKSSFRIQSESIFLNKLIKIFDISQLRSQAMSRNCDMVQCMPIDQGPGSILTFTMYQQT